MGEVSALVDHTDLINEYVSKELKSDLSVTITPALTKLEACSPSKVSASPALEA
nr:MAG TPA: hypothetical protein [Bacteriophage sp.]